MKSPYQSTRMVSQPLYLFSYKLSPLPLKKIIYLLFLLPHFLFAQSPQIDSLETLFSKAQSDGQRLDLLNDMTAIAFEVDLRAALIYTQRGIELAEKTNDAEWQPKFYEMHGRMYANLLELDSASLFFDKAMAGYQKVDNKRGQATTAFKVSWVFKKKEKIEKAMEADLYALKIMEELEDKEGIANAYGRVSEDLGRQGRQTEALEYAQKAIDLCLANNFQEQLYYSYINAGDAAIATGDNIVALDYYNKSLNLARTIPLGKMSLADITNSRGNALKRLGKHEEALHDYEIVLVLGNEINYMNAVNTAIANLGEINLLLGNYADALPYQLETIRLKEESNDFANLSEIYEHAASIYENIGDYASALKYERKSKVLRDSTLNTASDAKISELRTQYETEKKEELITAQQAELSQRNLVQWLSIGVAALLAGFLFFLYRSYRARNKANKLLEIKNAENELLLKEIHHRVKNNLEIVTGLLELQSAQVEDKDIKEAMREGQNRVQSIGIVHQKLYQGENLGAIEMKEYILNLSESVLDSYGAEDRITIECAMEKLEVDIDTAVPLGLILNELLTNTLKYAFPAGQKGNVRILLKKGEENVLHLEVADNGIGKSDITQGTGFGSQLIFLLTRQLSGSMREERVNGTTFYFDFNVINKAA